jgi:hypothetical protein
LAILSHTHWIAVDGEFVYDINWKGWLSHHALGILRASKNDPK